MTAENNGVPEDDDPFAYLYRSEGDADGGAEGAAPTQPMPGVPRTSYQQATQVGRAQYGQSGYGQQPGYGQQQGYGAQQTQVYGGGYQGGVPQQGQNAPVGPPPGGGRGGSRGGGGSSRGVMLGAVAVVVAIAIGIGFAVFSSSGGKNDNASSGSTVSQSASTGTGSASASASASATSNLGPTDAATLKLNGTAPVATPAGAKAAGGQSVPLSGSGQSITWTVNIPSAGNYYVWARYNNPGADAKVEILVNGTKARDGNFANWGHSSDASQAWYRTYSQPQLPAGQVTITFQGEDGQPVVDLDQVAITPGNNSPWS